MKEFYFKKKNLFHAHYVMPNILIQENQGIAKLFTLLLESPFEQSYGVYNTCIILGYLHSF
jgi:hypothetical protein